MVALANGVSAFLVDTDTVFLQDPYDGLVGDADVWIQDGSPGCHALNEALDEFNTGFMCAQAGSSARNGVGATLSHVS